MSIGDSSNILDRVKQLLPARWFAWAAPYRDAVLGGLSDLGSWCYGFIIYARLQSRLATATSFWLDVWSYDFLGRNLLRNDAGDDGYRALIKATILKERVTRAGMSSAVANLTGNVPWIFEPWNTGDAGAYSNVAKNQLYGQMGYGVGKGGYGSLQFPGQVFMKVVRGASSGVPNITGYGYGAGGYSGPKIVNGQTSQGGNIAYVGSYTRQQGVTDEMIEQLITFTKPTGVTVWVRFA
jgi:hypothetical protein